MRKFDLKHTLLTTTALSLSFYLAIANAQEEAELSPFAQSITAAMSSDIRSADERLRDDNRKPVETLEFFGITGNMRVLELFPGGGWYSKLLAPALAENGALYTAFSSSSIKPLIAEHAELSAVTALDLTADVKPTAIDGIYNFQGYDFGLKKLDAVLTFRNAHNLDAESRAYLNHQVFKALKKGGVYAVVDHTLRHNAPITQEVFRRIDPVVIVHEALAAGFEFEAMSDLHYRPDDSLQFDTQRASVKRNSDRFTLRFRKP